MELLVVGSGAAYPNRPGTASSCYVVLHDGAAICLDMGQGAFAGLAGRLEPADLAGVVVSHLHPDHFVDLVALRHYLRYEFNPPRRLRVIAPAGLGRRLDGVTGEPGFARETLEIEDRAAGHLQVGPFALESVRVTHTDDSFATRVTLAAWPGGPAIVYSGDCGRAEDLVPLILPGDMLLCEVAFGPGPVPVPDLHLDGAAVGILAAETEALTPATMAGSAGGGLRAAASHPDRRHGPLADRGWDRRREPRSGRGKRNCAVISDAGAAVRFVRERIP